VRPALGLLAALLVLYLLWILFLFLAQAKIAYPAAGGPARASAPPPGADVVWVDAGGARVETWYLPPRGGARGRAPALLFGHGNGETIDDMAERFAPLRDLGLGVLLVEYPGYGRSTGAPSEGSIAAAFLAAYDLLARREDVDASRIVAFGQSLGGGAVCTLLSKRPVAAVVLLSTFSSARIFARRYLAPGFLVRDVFDNVRALDGYGGPVLVVHGERDALIPKENGEALRRAARGRLLTYDCAHWCWDREGGPLFADVAAFLGEAGVLQPHQTSSSGFSSFGTP
jgi:pimeloyl-ACP methyl ester carboxylesterase